MNALHNLSVRVDSCPAEIDSRNRKNLMLFSDGALLIAAAAFTASLLCPPYRGLILQHGFLVLYAAVLFFFARYCRRKKASHIRLLMYLSFAPLMLCAVLMGTVFDPGKPAITILIFLCILPLFIIDRPWRIIFYQLGFAALFVLCSFLSKPPEVFQADVLYLPIYLSLCIAANVFSLIDKVESAENYAQLRRKSERDVLTELLNRKSGEEKVQTLLRAQVHGAFAILDVDDFKLFNDQYGHQAGDDALCEVSRALQSVFRTSDVIWRLGGDEFAVYAVNLLDPDICRRRVEALMEKLESTTVPPFDCLSIRVSVGCTICRDGAPSFDEIYRSSDEALYEAKNAGKGRLVITETGARPDAGAQSPEGASHAKHR